MPPVRLTVTSVAVALGVPSSAAVTVTVVAVAPSLTDTGFTDSVSAVDVVSSSVIVSVCASPSLSPFWVAVTWICSSSSSTRSSTAVMVAVTVLSPIDRVSA